MNRVTKSNRRLRGDRDGSHERQYTASPMQKNPKTEVSTERPAERSKKVASSNKPTNLIDLFVNDSIMQPVAIK